jgi:hypothetical protein
MEPSPSHPGDEDYGDWWGWIRGSVLVLYLLSLGRRVVCGFDNLMCGGRGLLPCFACPGFDFVKCSILDEPKMKQALRDTPPTSLCEGLAKTVEWYRANKIEADKGF